MIYCLSGKYQKKKKKIQKEEEEDLPLYNKFYTQFFSERTNLYNI